MHPDTRRDPSPAPAVRPLSPEEIRQVAGGLRYELQPVMISSYSFHGNSSG